MLRVILAGCLTAAVAMPVFADDVTDTLNSAISAYEEGDIQYALEELEYAKQLIGAMQTDALTGFLPEPPEGWTREVSTELTAGLMMMGGGTGAEAEYSNGDQYFTITIMVDNPMIAAIGGMIANAGMMGMKLQRVGREKFLEDDGELSGLIGGRILIQAEGADPAVMIAVLEQIDMDALADFGR